MVAPPTSDREKSTENPIKIAVTYRYIDFTKIWKMRSWLLARVLKSMFSAIWVTVTSFAELEFLRIWSVFDSKNASTYLETDFATPRNQSWLLTCVSRSIFATFLHQKEWFETRTNNRISLFSLKIKMKYPWMQTFWVPKNPNKWGSEVGVGPHTYYATN